jgi:hypothetical protein
MTTTAPTKERIPFGKYQGKPLGTVPKDYLQWAASVLKLGSGLLAVVAAELQRRRVPVPEPPPPRQPQCGQCGPGAGIVCRWFEDSLGRQHVKGSCAGCGQPFGFVPTVPPYTDLADAAKVAR